MTSQGPGGQKKFSVSGPPGGSKRLGGEGKLVHVGRGEDREIDLGLGWEGEVLWGLDGERDWGRARPALLDIRLG